MDIGDLVKWSDSSPSYLVGHMDVILRLESISNNEGAWIRWLTDECGPQEAWTPLICIEKV